MSERRSPDPGARAGERPASGNVAKASEPKFDLSTVQVASSVLAALTGAVAMSYVGIGGTILGAGVGTLASTTSTAIYRHYLWRTRERMQAAARARAAEHAKALQRARAAGQAKAAATAGQDQPHQATAAARTPAPPADPDKTQVLEVPPARSPVDAEPTEIYHTPPAGIPADAAPTHIYQAGTAELAAADAGVPPGSGAAGDPPPGRPGGGRQRWLVLTGVTVGVFVVAMAGITVVEAAVGKPLQMIVWHHHGSGTTMGSIMGGNQTTKAGTQPTTSPTAVPVSSTAAGQPTQAQPTAAQPTPSASPSQTAATAVPAVTASVTAQANPVSTTPAP